jgi:putative mRNA 3-end processing factor
MSLIEHTAQGLYCPTGDFYIDPWKPVDRAVITHAHSDHARPGSKHYLCHTDSIPLLRLRLGQDISCQGLPFGETITIGEARVSLHPAGHIIGSAQVRVEHKGETWVVSGDYKTENDGLSGVFEPVRCDSFITESTFALPIYAWEPQEQLFERMATWIARNQESGITSVLLAYSLGKAQRLIQRLGIQGIPMFVHGAIWNVQETLLAAGWKLPSVQRINPQDAAKPYKGQVVIAPPSAADSPWLHRFQPYALGVCSGWMQVRGNIRRRNADAGFALSDHADWSGLLSSIRATGASQVLVTHGFQSVLSRYLRETDGILAQELATEYKGEEEGTSEPEPAQPDSGTALDSDTRPNPDSTLGPDTEPDSDT